MEQAQHWLSLSWKRELCEITRSNDMQYLLLLSWEWVIFPSMTSYIGSQAWRDTLHNLLWMSIPFQSTTSSSHQSQMHMTLSSNKCTRHFLSTRLCISLTYICQYNAYNDLARATFIELATFIINSECDRMIHTWPCELLLACQDVISHIRCQIEIWQICRYTCEWAKQLPLIQSDIVRHHKICSWANSHLEQVQHEPLSML